MGEIAAQFIKIVTRMAFVLAAIIGFIILINFAFSLVFVTLNQDLLNDIIVLVQLWLPFNLNAMTSWLLVASSLYVTYRLTVAGIAFVSRLVGNG